MHVSAKVDRQTSALLLIEFQEEWLSEQGKLRHLFKDKEQFLDSVANAKEIITATRRSLLPVIHSGLGYSNEHKELGKAQYGLRAAITSRQTFLAASAGSQFAKPFHPHENEFIVSGRTGASAFAGSNLDSYLRNNRINTLFIMGYALHVCVESTLRTAHDLGYEAILIEDACAAFTAQQKTHVLEEIVHHFGARIKKKDYLTILKEI